MKKTYICYVCGKEFERYSSTVKNPETVCCSKKCSEIVVSEKVSGKNNPNFRHGEYFTGSFCSCGNPKDHRASRCSSCARVGFAKKGAKTIFDLDESSLRDIVLNSLSAHSVAKTTGVSRQTVRRLIDKYKIDISHFVPSGKAKRYLKPEIVLIKNSEFENAAVKALVFRLGLLENKCYECGLVDWYGKKITLQLHHINGDSKDMRIENLTILCPNCHSLTNTFTGKNTKRSIK